MISHLVASESRATIRSRGLLGQNLPTLNELEILTGAPLGGKVMQLGFTSGQAFPKDPKLKFT